MDYSTKAEELFLEGYNCTQAVVLAFSDKTGLDKQTAAKLASSFGGGFARLREVCGAVSGMCMVAGLLYGYDDISDKSLKTNHYKLIQELAGRFSDEAGSIVCRELLGKNGKDNPIPEDRTKEYYKTRPCARMVGLAARIMEEYIKDKEGCL